MSKKFDNGDCDWEGQNMKKQGYLYSIEAIRDKKEGNKNRAAE